MWVIESFCGRLQFFVPFLKTPINWLAGCTVAAEGVIQHGVGRGLRFCGKGGYPGYLLGTSEIEEQRVLAQNLTPGKVFYDIGANIGFYSTLAARLAGPGGRVFAFEPFGASAETCRRNAHLNGFDHVVVIEAAAGECCGQMTLELGNASAVHRLNSIGHGCLVRVIGIDQWRIDSQAPAPDLVMIDVEGAEIEVLRGMLETVKERLPTIMVEVHWLGEAFSEFVKQHLVPLGYEMTTYNGESTPPGVVRYHALLRCGDRVK